MKQRKEEKKKSIGRKEKSSLPVTIHNLFDNNQSQQYSLLIIFKAAKDATFCERFNWKNIEY
jgi:hypothetical protein